MIELLLFAVGLLIATVFSMVGLAGGTLIVPVLVLGFGLATQRAVGTSLFAVTFITISAAIMYGIQRRVHFKVGLLLDTMDVPGAIVGAYLTTLIHSNLLAGMFGALLLFISIHVFMRRNASGESGGGLRLNSRTAGACVIGSFLSGMVSAMFGVGGGVVDELVMILVLGMAIHLSAGTAMFGMAITTVAAVIPHWLLGNVAIEYAIPLAIGGGAGGLIGAGLSGRVRALTLRRTLAVLIALIGLRMILVPLT
ncbi:MAG: sulfite exporter TauE/SafE family protein [Candidatus Hadarchaeales archaeon]